ncbi:MAG: autotransporter outer membrane beta-barrel domain-containing protein [Limisphaerales bacterium]
MRTLAHFSLLALWMGQAAASLAQDVAPDTIAGRLFTVTITAGGAPFQASGAYRLFTSPAGSNFVVLGNAGAGLGAGTYSYTKTGASNGVMTLADANSGSGVSMRVAFASTTTGSAVLTNAGAAGFQNADVALTQYVELRPPALLLPDRSSNSQFRAYLSGDTGVAYAVETSTNLSTWSSITNLTLADLSIDFTDTNTANGSARYYRTKVVSAEWAPDSIAGRTFNVTIREGGSPLGTTGIYQLVVASTNNSYLIVGGPGTTNSSGTYAYAKTGPQSGMITLTAGQGGGTLRQQVVFTSIASGFYYTSSSTSAGFQAGTFTMADGAVEFLGNLKSVPDTARAASLLFPADGNVASFSVTNANGYIWTLSFPKDALLTPQTITMTPFASIDSSSAMLPATSGVLLEPDGIQFNAGVTLTVSVPTTAGAHASLMMGGQDGSAIYFVQTTNQARSYSTTLFHFTSGGLSDPTDQQWQDFLNNHLAEARAAYNQAKSDAKALERPVVVPPEPPDYELTCDPKGNPAADRLIDAYQQTVFAKEADAIRRMLGAARALALMDQDPGDEPLVLARELIETAVYRKVDSLFSHYSSNPKKFNAVVQVALGVMREDALLGGQERSDWWDKITSWAYRVRTYYFDKLRNEHDYSMVKILISVQAQINLLVGGNNDDAQFFSNLEKAMTFKLTLNISFTFSGPTANDYLEAQGDVPLTPDPQFILPMQGNGSINYLTGSGSGTGGSGTLQPGQSFPENVQVTSFDACRAMTTDIVLDRFGLDAETWIVDGNSFDLTPGLLGSGCAAAFSGHKNNNGYSFTLPLRNRQAEAVNQIVEQQSPDGMIDAKVKFVLEHTPK